MNNALKEVKTIKDHSKIIDCLLLQDGRIALSSDYIKIYDIVTAKCNITINFLKLNIIHIKIYSTFKSISHLFN